MRKFIYIVLASLVLAACHRGPKAIPEKDMRSIMREALISQAILQVDNSGDTRLKPIDSLDLHTDILKKYGYTLEDFRFTVREMSMRKSNPLANILSGVATDIKAFSSVAEARYKEQLKIDSTAQARTADTVFLSDTVLRGRFDGYKIVYTGPAAKDSAVAPGTYRLSFDYSTGSHARSYTKSVRTRRTGPSGSLSESTLWIPVAKDTTRYEGEIKVGNSVRQLDITLSETLRPDIPKDTCYLTAIRLVRILPVRQARDLFLSQLTGFPSDNLETYYEKSYLDSHAQRGGPVPPRSGR